MRVLGQKKLVGGAKRPPPPVCSGLINTNLGQIGGRSATRCHNGEIKEFRQRCNKVN